MITTVSKHEPTENCGFDSDRDIQAIDIVGTARKIIGNSIIFSI